MTLQRVILSAAKDLARTATQILRRAQNDAETRIHDVFICADLRHLRTKSFPIAAHVHTATHPNVPAGLLRHPLRNQSVDGYVAAVQACGGGRTMERASRTHSAVRRKSFV